jgi:hypothetical protein
MAEREVTNPFVVIGFRGAAYFCDRARELEQLIANFENGRNTVLYAWRRMGKTSLLRFLSHEIETRKAAHAVYVDLLPTRSIDDALVAMVRALQEVFKRNATDVGARWWALLGQIGLEVSFDPVTGMPAVGLGLRQALQPLPSLSAIGKFLSEQDREVLFIFDEFQEVVNYEDGNAEAVFRTWMQQFPQIRFVFSGSNRGMMSSIFTERNRPFYRSAELVQLDAIPLDVYRAFIEKHFTAGFKTIDQAAIDAIYTWGRGQTHAVQLVCNKLYASYDFVTVDDVNEVTNGILIQETPVATNYRSLLTRQQWNVLTAVAKAEPLRSPSAASFIERYRLGASSSVRSSIASLLEKELLIEEDGAVLVHDVILLRWLQSQP